MCQHPWEGVWGGGGGQPCRGPTCNGRVLGGSVLTACRFQVCDGDEPSCRCLDFLATSLVIVKGTYGIVTEELCVLTAVATCAFGG